ncbi:MAG: chain-length determining protein [Bacteroidaceae bacterium]|nr:chain-length determining protein [Bacteroidaceae bacterium]
MEKKTTEYIDLRKVTKRLWERRKTYYKVLPVVFVVACAYVLCLPRYYRTEAQLVPEIANSGLAGGGLADLVSSFGINLNENMGSDAISPVLYPDLMSDNGFVASLFNIRVQSCLEDDPEEHIDTTYYAYMHKFQKRTFWSRWMNTVKQWFTPKEKGAGGAFNPYRLSKIDDGVMEEMRAKIDIAIDKKTAVITLKTEAQDPLIAQTLADSIQHRLQVYITNYRTNKARIDMNYYRGMADQAKHEYDSVRHVYARAYDREYEAVLRTLSAELDDQDREMQMKYQTYTTLETQYQAALARVQECTPAFSVLKGAAKPVKHAGPKRVFLVLGFLFLAFVCTSLYLLKDDIKAQLSQS